MNYETGLSPADFAAITGNNNRNNDGFGDGNGWWIILLFLIFGFGGWNNRGGFGGNGSNGGGYSGVADNYVLATDFATIERKLDGINNGICDSTFALNNTMTNGFAATQQTLCQGFSGINQGIMTNGYETRLGVQNLGASLADCCCTLRQQISDTSCATQRAIDGVNYNNLINTNTLNNSINTGFTGIQNAMCLNTRDIIDNQNANYRALHDEIVANRIEDKNAQITAQQNEINALRLAASQEKQNNYLINELKPCPIPAYITCNPYQSYGYYGTGCNSGCGCNNF